MTIQEIVEEIKTKTDVELCELVKALEEEFGVSAAAPVAVAAAPAASVCSGYARAGAGDRREHAGQALSDARRGRLCGGYRQGRAHGYDRAGVSG